MARPRKTFVNIGQRFGRLVVTGEIVGPNAPVRCDCGVEKTTNLYGLVRGDTLSCGCHRAEQSVRRWTTHGGSASPEFFVWNNMIQRCENPTAINYGDYGARGITVSPEWHDFGTFIADMGPRPVGGDRYTVERIDNDKGYSKANCKWATYSEQQRNTSRTIFVEFQGRRRCLREISEITGTPYPRLFYRHTHGWPIEKAVSIGAWGDK